MKAILLTTLTTLSIGTSVAAYPVPSQPPSTYTQPTPLSIAVEYPGRCYQGSCFDHRLDRRTLIKTTNTGILYAVETSNREYTFEDTDPKSKPFKPAGHHYVFCSTSRPAVIFQPTRALYLAHTLNPGTDDYYGYNMVDYAKYWLVCHNYVADGTLNGFFTDLFTERAISLGYPLNLPVKAIELIHTQEITE